MLTANVLCLKRKKKKKKGDYIISNLPDTIIINDGKSRGQKSGNMLHITEDTPADMLSGAMDLTIHLPSGKAVKMCVERRTPMMDLLVQVTTNHQLQITNYTLQPLQTSCNDNYSEKVLSYYPNTPIGALDTQHIKVIPKTRTLPIKKNVPAGPQPFETTFRLKVHLPRNQLYVTRVSKHVHIEDIMRKVCDEKNLDPNKYEVRHPGNLDEVLDPKLTLNDYMITEINLVVKGSNAPAQTFTSDDIMTLRKEEERKAAPNKSGGVFNLLFRRGKSNNVSTTAPPITKEPATPPRREDPSPKPKPEIEPIAKNEPQKEKPKVPQRKRRPAPKPPQSADKPPQAVEKPPAEEPVQMRNGSVISDNSNASDGGSKNETTVLTICHSRHSSDSSGYHETSILSDQCNTSLPRRNRLEEADTMVRKLNRYSESTGNLTKMTTHSRSTSSLIFPGRKKKAAPPPPKPLQISTSSRTNLQNLSPVVASQTHLSSSSSKTDLSLASQGTQNSTNPPPLPKRRKGHVATSVSLEEEEENDSEILLENEADPPHTDDSLYSCPYQTDGSFARDTPDSSRPPSNMSTIDILKSLEYLNLDDQGNEIKPPAIIGVLPKDDAEKALKRRPFILDLVDKNLDDDNTSVTTESPVKNETTSIISDVSSVDIPPRRRQLRKEFSVSSVQSSESALFEEGRIRRWGSWEKLNQSSVTSSAIDEEHGCSTSEVEDSENQTEVNTSMDITKEKNYQNSDEYSSREIISTENKQTDNFELKLNAAEEQDKHIVHCMEEKNVQLDMNESKNVEQVDGISCPIENEWCFEGVQSSTDLSSTPPSHPAQKILVSSEKSFADIKTTLPIEENKVMSREDVYTNNVTNEISLDDVERYKNYGNSPDSGNSSEISEKSKIDDELNNPEMLDVLVANQEEIAEWQLPSPPKAFKDAFPNNQLTDTEISETDSVITPELIEKLEKIEKQQSLEDDKKIPSDYSELILSKLSLENLEKRKSLVYNRELATSLKQSYESQSRKEDEAASTPQPSNPSKKIDQTEKVLDEIRINNARKEAEMSMDVKHSTLPNFKITTYDEPKQIKVFEDDTIRSNSDFSGKSLSLNRGNVLQTTGFRRSMENIAVRRNDPDSNDMDQHRIYRPKTDNYRRSRAVNRSGSFSIDQNEWISSKPVARSKSQVAIRMGERRVNGFEAGNMSKSSSLFDVSGLQSLEVMKKIQNKLNTPTTSMETLSKIGLETKVETKRKEEEEVPMRRYQYAGPPSINMGTWSDRPKVPVSVKEDADYKLGQGTNRRHYKPSVQSTTTITDSSQQNHEKISRPSESQRVTITCNGPSEQRNDFNVLIKIEDQNRRFPEHNGDSTYRTSYSLNRNTQRPHSVAFASDFDISRVPVVRSVELKKTFRDIPTNTSVTQLNQTTDNYYSNGFTERSRVFNNQDTNGKDEYKHVMRAKSFLQTAPVVRGFRRLENNLDSDSNGKVAKYNRSSWQPSTSMTLPANPKKDTHTTNQNVPFSRFNLRRTESKCLKEDNTNNPPDLDRIPDQVLPVFSKPAENLAQTRDNLVQSVIPKPPPEMPRTIQKKITKRQFVPVADPRDELLKSIRDFGGKKGLRSRKA